jgi:hypothetical protein
VSGRDLHYQFWSLKQGLKCLIVHPRCSSISITLFTCYFSILITHTSSLMCRLVLTERDWSFESWRAQSALMAPYASSRRRKKRGKGEGESSREAELGAQSPQCTGPTVRGASSVSQVHIALSLWFKFLFRFAHGLGAWLLVWVVHS